VAHPLPRLKKDSIRQPSLNFACSTCNQYLDERCKNHPEGHGATNDNTPGIVSVQSDRILTPQTGMLRHGSEAAPNPQSTIPDAGHGTTHDNTPGIVSVQSDRIPTPQMGMHVVWFGSEAAPNPQSTIPAIQNRQCKYDTSISPLLKVYAAPPFIWLENLYSEFQFVPQINFILCIHSPCSAYNSFA
jgi:hypothetical protein